MGLRRLLNLGYASLVEGMDSAGKQALDLTLNEKFEHEMTEAEAKRAEAFRRTVAAGGLDSQRNLAAMMGGPRR